MSFRLTVGLFASILLVSSCNPSEDSTNYWFSSDPDSSSYTDYTLSGTAQGTTYNIKYWGDSLSNFQDGIDSLLQELDSSLSTYLPGSIISQVNSQKSTVVDRFFNNVFTRSVEINQITHGAFDPSIMPLVQAWGFGPEEAPQIDTTLVDSLRALVGLSRFGIYFSMWKNEWNMKSDTSYVMKTNPRAQLDFNGIAQGYSVDILSYYLEEQGVQNYMIELGGEIKASGKKADGQWWKIGIDKPEEHAKKRLLQATIALKDRSIATSGSYRKFYELNGVKYSHTIDPSTGYPVTHSLLSVSVITYDCMSADAYATAFLVMGLEKSKHFLEFNADLALEVYFIYTDEEGNNQTFATSGLDNILNEDLKD